MKQINSQSDLISMSSFAGPPYLRTGSSVCITLIRDPCICNRHNLCQTGSSYIHRRKPHQQCALNFIEQITRAHFLLLQPCQTSQTVGDFYDVIGRIGSISAFKVHPRRSPTIGDFYDGVNMKFACLGHRGCLILVFTCYQSLILSEFSILNL